MGGCIAARGWRRGRRRACRRPSGPGRPAGRSRRACRRSWRPGGRRVVGLAVARRLRERAGRCGERQAERDGDRGEEAVAMGRHERAPLGLVVGETAQEAVPPRRAGPANVSAAPGSSRSGISRTRGSPCAGQGPESRAGAARSGAPARCAGRGVHGGLLSGGDGHAGEAALAGRAGVASPVNPVNRLAVAVRSRVAQGKALLGGMDIRVLGPVEASAGGKPVLVGAGKPRALLALLALNAGSTVRRIGSSRGSGVTSRRRQRPRWCSCTSRSCARRWPTAATARRSSRAGAVTSCGSATASWTRGASSSSSRRARRATR